MAKNSLGMSGQAERLLDSAGGRGADFATRQWPEGLSILIVFPGLFPRLWAFAKAFEPLRASIESFF